MLGAVPLHLVVFRGLPGSGKSTAAREQYPEFYHYEPDHFFCDTAGRYLFDAQLWASACGWCEDMTDFALAKGHSVVVSDVFARHEQLAPYRNLALAHGAEFKVITMKRVMCQQNLHRIPVAVLRRMLAEFDFSDYEPAPA